MKRNITILFQVVVVLIGIVALVIMVWFPLTEGRATNLDLFSIYADPFILYGYLASTAFFIALYQAFKLLGYIGQNRVFSLSFVKALRIIIYCAIAGIGFIVVGEVWLFIITMDGMDDPAGPRALGIIFTFVSIIIAIVASAIEKHLRSVVSTKSGDDVVA